jgi:AcrR family transcriptional regulator
MARASATRRRTANRDDVLAAARDILDEEGIDALTMANVASRVGFTTMAVYRHVRNRDDLLEGVVDLVLHDIAAHDERDAAWLDGVERWMRDVREHLVAHPWAATRLGTRTGVTPAWGATVGILGAHLVRSPLSPRGQARALAFVTRVTVGIVIEEVGAPLGPERRKGRTAQSTSPGARRSAQQRLMDEFDRVTNDDLFDDVVDQTLDYLRSLVPSRS